MKQFFASKITLAVFSLVAGGLSGFLPAQSQTSGVDKQGAAYTYLPDRNVRALVRGVRLRQVASIRFFDLPHGSSVPAPDDPSAAPVRHPSFEPAVTDRRLIGRFLYALRDASDDNSAHPAISHPSVEIDFQQSPMHPRQPLVIEFNDAAFGPQFQDVMDALPGQMAEELHRWVRSAAPQVREVDFVGIKVTDPAEVARIVRDLERVDQDGFEVCSSDSNFEAKLLLNGRRSVDVVLSVEPVPGSRKSPLPGTLRAYYERVERATKSLSLAGAMAQ